MFGVRGSQKRVFTILKDVTGILKPVCHGLLLVGSDKSASLGACHKRCTWWKCMPWCKQMHKAKE